MEEINWDKMMSMSIEERQRMAQNNRNELLGGVKHDTEQDFAGKVSGASPEQRANVKVVADTIRRRQSESSVVNDPKSLDDLRLGLDETADDIK